MPTVPPPTLASRLVVGGLTVLLAVAACWVLTLVALVLWVVGVPPVAIGLLVAAALVGVAVAARRARRSGYR